jgi:ribonuclease D
MTESNTTTRPDDSAHVGEPVVTDADASPTIEPPPYPGLPAVIHGNGAIAHVMRHVCGGVIGYPITPSILDEQLWIMQAAHNDLDCLAEIGLRPRRLFDTEIAAQLLGLEKVGLASLVETLLGYSLRKSHSQADWSRRPLRPSWLEYAALDVCLLPDLHEDLADRLAEAGKAQWAEQEFEHQIRQRPVGDPEQRWRRTTGAGRLRTDVQRGILRALWWHRDAMARKRDLSVHRIIRDQVLVEVARAAPSTPEQLAAVPNIPKPVVAAGDQWLRVIRQGAAEPMPGAERSDGPPPRNIRAWEQRDPEAAKRWVGLRERLAARAEELQVWLQILLAPDIVADLAWSPPDDPGARMRELGARPWQVEHTRDLVP